MRFILSAVLICMVFLLTLPGCEKKDEQTAKREQEKPAAENKQDAKTKRADSEIKELPSFAGLVKKLKPSVVNISTTGAIEEREPFQFQSPFGKEHPFGEFFEKFFRDIPQHGFRQRGLGSGFIISPDGYVVTNNHVIEKAQDVEVVLEDGEKYQAEIVGKDPKTDIALLKIAAGKKLPTVALGNSEKLEIGDWVVAIGNPFGLGHTVTAGIVSAKGRALGLGNYDDFIQTDASINPGNSGGPLFNMKGKVVGVNTAIIAGGQGIGFAIPIDIANRIVNQLKNKGKVVRGWLGVLVQDITPEIAEGMKLQGVEGALVADITAGGPAQKAGIKRGDIVVGFNGRKIAKVSELTNMVAFTAPGTQVELDLLRNGNRNDVAVRLGELPEEETASKNAGDFTEKLGLTVKEINPQTASRFNVEEETGVIVTEVAPGSIAQESGFQTGDVVIEINKKSVKDINDYRKAVEALEKGKSALFLVKRDKNTVFIAMMIE